MTSCFLLAGSSFFLVERIFLLILLILQLFQVSYRVHSDYPVDIDGSFLSITVTTHLSGTSIVCILSFIPVSSSF